MSEKTSPNTPNESSESMSKIGNARNPDFNPAKAKLAANHPERPGEKCRAEPGAYKPVVNQNRCEGKWDCVEVCPYNVFEVRKIDDADFEKLSFFGKLKSRAHGRQTAYTPRADLCHGCGLCVVACPERAIDLLKMTTS